MPSFAASAELSAWYGPDRNKPLVPFSKRPTPAVLTGDYLSDYVWDTSSVGADILEWYWAATLIHAGGRVETFGLLAPKNRG